MIYDGPAEGAPAADPTPAPEPEPVPAPSVQSTSHTVNELASFRQQRSARFERGLRLYRDGNLNEALAEFESAADAEPTSALYRYHQAVVLFDLYGAEAAEETLGKALAAERNQAISQWGQKMERIQGPARVWIEKARRNARLAR